VEQIATRLDDAFRLLTGGSRTALPRQQTLRALIDWSYNLLSDEEKIFLRRLSVFMGGWTLEAAEAVCGNLDALDLLTRLVDKSLVSVDLEHGNEPRYYLLETVRQYAREKLAETEEVIYLRDVHLEYFVKTAERIAPELYTRKMPYWLDYLETEYANLQAALEWAQKRDVEAGLRLCNALYRLWENCGEYIKEGLDWINKFLAMIPVKQNANHAWALYHAEGLASRISPNWFSPEGKGWLEESLNLARGLGEEVCIARALERLGYNEHCIGISHLDKARELLEQSLAVSRRINDDLAIGYALDWLGRIAMDQPDFSAARHYFEESLSILSKVGELRRWGLVFSRIGNMYETQGNWNAARNYYEQALSVANEAHSRLHISLNLARLGTLASGIGDFDQAISLLDHARILVQGTPDEKFLPDILIDLGEVARFQGNFDQAIIFFHELLLLPQRDDQKAIAYCYLAHTECLRGEILTARQCFVAGLQIIKTEQDWVAPTVIPYVAYFVVDQKMSKKAVSLLGWVDAWNKTKGIIQPPVYQEEFDRYLSQARERLSESEFNAAWAEGQSMSQEQVLALAEEVVQ
jgi:non-specific serine/threonine protein kinase